MQNALQKFELVSKDIYPSFAEYTGKILIQLQFCQFCPVV